MTYLMTNLPEILSVLSLSIGVAVAVSHLLHKEAVAQQLEAIQATVDSLEKPKASS